MFVTWVKSLLKKGSFKNVKYQFIHVPKIDKIKWKAHQLASLNSSSDGTFLYVSNMYLFGALPWVFLFIIFKQKI